MAMKMVLAVLVAAGCVTLLAGCVNKNSKPFSAQETAVILSQCYGVKITLVSATGETVQLSPGAKIRYVLRAEPAGFTFSALASVGYQTGGLRCQRLIDDQYPAALMLHHRQRAAELARQYGVVWRSVATPDGSPTDRVYVSEMSQLGAVAEFYFELQELYDFHVSARDYLRVAGQLMNSPQFFVYYLPDGETNLDKARGPVAMFFYAHRDSEDKRVSRNYRDPQAFLGSLENNWRYYVLGAGRRNGETR